VEDPSNHCNNVTNRGAKPASTPKHEDKATSEQSEHMLRMCKCCNNVVIMCKACSNEILQGV
jgi:hypothetical protein